MHLPTPPLASLMKQTSTKKKTKTKKREPVLGQVIVETTKKPDFVYRTRPRTGFADTTGGFFAKGFS